jgi:hypothetical protein
MLLSVMRYKRDFLVKSFFTAPPHGKEFGTDAITEMSTANTLISLLPCLTEKRGN